jgi:tRNA-Thr(GGU) m(6)t(6)A37 methyltransferase TsaA
MKVFEENDIIGLDSGNSIGRYLLQPIGYVRSSLKRLEDCRKQNWEGAPEAWVEINPAFAEGLEGITPYSEVILITWLHKARRNVLKVHPRGNPANALRGVFATRSPDRPNPVGLHRVEILEVEGMGRFRVRALEVLDGTPVIDIKPLVPKPSPPSTAP